MQFKRMLLMCSALITLAYSFPTGTQHISETLSSNETMVSDAKENRKPLVLIMEEKDAKSDSVVVQFVYTNNGGNSIIETENDKIKYVVDYSNDDKTYQKSNEKEKMHSVHTSTIHQITDGKESGHKTDEKESEQKTNKNENEQKTEGKENQQKTDGKNSKQNSDAEKSELKPDVKVNEKKPNIKESEQKPDTKKVNVMAVTSLMPQEVSPISAKWPKYFYDVFNPIDPFPELQYEKSNQINTDKVAANTGDTYLHYTTKLRKEPPFSAGPQLSPLSIYDREFDVPIFD